MSARWMWTAGLVVATAAAAATAHGSYGVARAAQVPAGIALLYPAITDGLALVAYATTTRLPSGGRRYAWTVVVLAAGLSGLAQAMWLAGGVRAVTSSLRFGVGAWPAIAAAVVAHLLYLLAAGATPDVASPEAVNAPGVQPPTVVQPAVQPLDAMNQAPLAVDIRVPGPAASAAPRPTAETPASAGDRAKSAARAHLDRHDVLPTVSQLVDAAGVARGTAAAALKELRTDNPERTHR